MNVLPSGVDIYPIEEILLGYHFASGMGVLKIIVVQY